MRADTRATVDTFAVPATVSASNRRYAIGYTSRSKTVAPSVAASAFHPSSLNTGSGAPRIHSYRPRNQTTGIRRAQGLTLVSRSTLAETPDDPESARSATGATPVCSSVTGTDDTTVGNTRRPRITTTTNSV